MDFFFSNTFLQNQYPKMLPLPLPLNLMAYGLPKKKILNNSDEFALDPSAS